MKCKTLLSVIGSITFLAICSPSAIAQPNRIIQSRSNSNPLYAQTQSLRQVAEVFRPILSQLKRETRVPILLPSQEAFSFPIQVYVEANGEANGYKISLGSRPNCGGVTVCFVGYLAAERGGRIIGSRGGESKEVRLTQGITGYLSMPVSRGRYKAPTIINWLFQGVLYTIQIRGENPEAYMIELANSAIEFGLQNSQVDRSSSEGRSIFKPILRDIQEQLPSNWVMRLPSDIVMTRADGTRVPIYARVKPSRDSSYNYFRIILTSRPNCQARACLFGLLATFSKEDLPSYSNWINSFSSKYRRVAPITLANGIRGTYAQVDPRGASTGPFGVGPFGVVLWEQDNQVFFVSLGYASSIEEGKEDVILAAMSMAKEPPIASINQPKIARRSPSENRSIFQPILRDIQQQLPSNWVMRLPSDIVMTRDDSTRVLIYANVEPSRGRENYLRISLTSRPNCQPRACQIGYLATFSKEDNTYSDWMNSYSSKYRRVAPITLANGIRGTYIDTDPRGASTGPFGVVLWEQDNQVFLVSLGYASKNTQQSKQETIRVAMSMAKERPIASINQPRIARRSPVKTYNNARELGMAQFLQGKQELISALEKLKRAAKQEYETNIDSFNLNLLKETVTTLSPVECRAVGVECERKGISYADYLELKMKYKLQPDIYKNGYKIFDAVAEYQKLLNNDNRYGGTQASDRLYSIEQEIKQEIAEKWGEQEEKLNRTTLENLVLAGRQALEDSGEMLGDLLFTTIIPKSIPSILDMEGVAEEMSKGLPKFMRILEKRFGIKPDSDEVEPTALFVEMSPEGLKFLAGYPKYAFAVVEFTKSLSQNFAEGNTDGINKTCTKMAEETLEFLNNFDDFPGYAPKELASISKASREIMETSDVLEKPEVRQLLDDFDKLNLQVAQLSATLDMIDAVISLINKKVISKEQQVVQTLGKMTKWQLLAKFLQKTLKDLIADGTKHTYKNDLQRTYPRFLFNYERNQIAIEGLSKFLDKSAEEVGEYLIKARSDVIVRQADGKIAVMTDKVLSPP
ncbi:hypothetical protein [Okeania sp. KiyG1]|uniref:hypothetical protein n=1 Tax=Okeania sp. KiyG1 TaxID=2720165 RepID=UPI001F2B2653|nr:hypothetical protein [Okeania sp. KiyG1]